MTLNQSLEYSLIRNIEPETQRELFQNLQLRIALVEWSPYVQSCAVQYETLVSTVDCHRPGIYSEYLHALLLLAHINYTILPVYINSETNFTWGIFINSTNWYDGLLGQLKDDYDLILSPYSKSAIENGDALLSWFIPAGAAGLSMVYRKQSTNFWKEASWPLRVFDMQLWGLQIGVFIIGAIALTLSRYVVKKFVIYEMKRSASLSHLGNRWRAKVFSDRLFHYYAVMVGQGNWENFGRTEGGHKIRTHMNILYIILALSVMFGAFLYEGVMLTAFLIPQATPEIESSEKFLTAVSSAKYKMAIETAWPLYVSLTDENIKQTGALGEISDIIRRYGVKNVPDTFSEEQVANLILSSNYIYLSEYAGRVISISNADCRLVAYSMHDIQSHFQLGMPMAKNNQTAIWLKQMLRHQAALYPYHGLLFEVYKEHLMRHRTCPKQAHAETSIDGETPQYAALTFVDVFGIILVTIAGFCIATVIFIFELAKKYRRNVIDRDAQRDQINVVL